MGKKKSKKSIKVCLDMDGTIADLYGYPDWLEHIQNEDTTPYRECLPLGSILALNTALDLLGATVQIISWNAKGATTKYKNKISAAKRNWLRRNGLEADTINIYSYGSDKAKIALDKWDAAQDSSDIYAFDDDPDIIVNYKRQGIKNAFLVNGIDDILDILRNIEADADETDKKEGAPAIQYILDEYDALDNKVGFKIGSTTLARKDKRIKEIKTSTRQHGYMRNYIPSCYAVVPTRNKAYIMEDAVREFFESQKGYMVTGKDHFIGYDYDIDEVYSNPFIKKAMELTDAQLIYDI